MILRNLVPLLSLTAIGGFSQPSIQPPVPLSAEMFSCWTSGSGRNYMKLCVSRHGNLTSFQSPSGKDHIRIGNITEGYTVCHQGAIAGSLEREYMDVGHTEAGWLEPYKVQQPGGKNTLPLTIYRKSTDGTVELVQTFSRDTAELDLTITMKLYNRSGKKLYNVRLMRTTDFDVNGTPTNDIFLPTWRSLVAWDSKDGSGVSVMGVEADDAVFATYKNWSDASGSSCEPGGNLMLENAPPAPGDYIGVLRQGWGVHLAAGASRTLTVIYRAQ